MEQRLAQEPLPIGLGHLAAYSSHGATLRTRASPTRTRPPCSLLLPRSNASRKSLFHRDSATLQFAPHMDLLLTWSNASHKSLSHWDAATLQLAPPKEQCLAQEPLPQGFGHLAACSFHGATLRARASPTGTRPPCSLLLTWSNTSRKNLSHWVSATLQLALSMEQSLAQEPLPLGCGHLAACSSHGATLRARASPTETRPPCSLLLPWSNASCKSLSHEDSATLQLALPMEQHFVQEPLPLGLGHLVSYNTSPNHLP
ncbi:hypothetical protein Adt_20104 [Abeliophyllum distichum]|uniref:Uncharacterized protein n=1 Tax=Abeliophyllum distichum TaxID=126358 RepID=A0ABD1SUT5_9LAMI